MAHKFAEIAFTDTVKAVQESLGSRNGYARLQGRDGDTNGRLGPRETAFIGERDSFYMASISETGWPYVQHRGGPRGFVRVLDEVMIGFADFAGNRQYVSVGNLMGDDRVSLFFMDYANRARLKLFGRAMLIAGDDARLIEQLRVPGQEARIERGILIKVEAFDWNCPQHITPRFTADDVEGLVGPLKARIEELEAERARVKAEQSSACGG